MKYLNVAVFSNIENILTYKSDAQETTFVGKRVIVPLGNKYVTGIVIEEIIEEKITIQKSKIKDIKEIIDDETVLGDDLIKLGLWVTDYYVSAPGIVFSTMLAPLSKAKTKTKIVLNTSIVEIQNLSEKEKTIIDFLKKCRKQSANLKDIEKKTGIKDITKITKQLKEKNIINIENITKVKDIKEETVDVYKGEALVKDIVLNDEQNAALQKIQSAIEADKFKVFLLMGITGSGKTEIYIKAAEHTVNKGKKVIVLVPEIFLTPQILERFKGVFKERIAVYHSGLGDKQRLSEWLRIKNNQVDVVIGTRSAVFAPFENVGLIVVDEEFDTSYKQENDPRYNAREVAVMRMFMSRGVAVLGSATPSVESYYNTQINKYELLQLKNRVNNKPLPEIVVVDLKYEKDVSKNFIFSNELVKQINWAMDENDQAILFINRRGFSSYIFCFNCGYVEKCVNCDIPLVYHKDITKMKCHYCGFEKEPVMICPKCGKQIFFKGTGTQKVEDVIKKFFPDKNILRVDIDSMQDKKSYFEVYNKIKNKKIDILVGTQMIAKGFDFPEMNFAGIINIDTVLNLPDFRSEERVFQLITQVAGRIGRGDKPGIVVVQTYRPECMAVKYASTYNIEEFYKNQIELRKQFKYPPFSIILQIISQDKNQQNSFEKIKKVKSIIDNIINKNNYKISILGPSPAPLFRLRNKYRYSIILKCNNSDEIKKIGRAVKKQRRGNDILVIVSPVNTL
jgi:primosomal protein N' (replication factor Y)